MRKVFSCVLAGLLLLTAASAQNLVSFNRSGTMTVAQTNQMITKAFGSAVAPASEALDLYKISYRSRDEKNRPVVLTGLLVFPKGGAPKGLVVFNHGTLADRKRSPSRFTGKADDSEAQTATLAFASGGYAVVMPDYLGLGDHTGGAHPYPLGAVNSRSAVDIIAPAREVAKRLKTIRRRGVGENLLRQYVVNDASLNHITGMPAATVQARRFFDEGFSD